MVYQSLAWKGLKYSDSHILNSLIIIPTFSLEKYGILFSYKSRSVVRPCVRLSVRASVRPPVTCLVIVSPPKPWDVTTSNFVDA